MRVMASRTRFDGGGFGRNGVAAGVFHASWPMSSLDPHVVLDREIVEQLDGLPRAHEAGADPAMRRELADVLPVEHRLDRTPG